MLRILFCLTFAFNTGFLFSYEFEVAMGSIFNNEAPFLKEWIDYHRLIGVQHFWLYNDKSTDHWAEVLQPYVDEGLVEVIDWSECRERLQEWPQIQIEAFKDTVQRALGRSRWLALIDTDEFILPMKNKSIQNCLRQYFSKANAVYMQWIVFGTGCITLEENESMLSSLNFCSKKQHPWNSVGKTIVRPEKVIIDKIWYVHHLPLNNGGHYTSGSGKKIPMVNFDLQMTSHQGEYIRINHYFFRDEKFYREVKIPRKLKRNMTLEELSRLYDDCLYEHDFAIINLLDKIN